jgi:Flp pilus assembly protein TadG
MAAAEFALVLPAMLVLVFGSIEVTNALTCKTDVSNAASTGADLIAQESSVGASDLLATYSALGSIVYPNAMGNMKIVLTSVIDDGHGGGKVDWSKSYNATARTAGSAVTVPAGLITTGGSVILSEVTYNYRTPTTYLVNLPITMTDVFYSKPRRVAQVKWNGP